MQYVPKEMNDDEAEEVYNEYTGNKGRNVYPEAPSMDVEHKYLTIEVHVTNKPAIRTLIQLNQYFNPVLGTISIDQENRLKNAITEAMSRKYQGPDLLEIMCEVTTDNYDKSLWINGGYVMISLQEEVWDILKSMV